MGYKFNAITGKFDMVTTLPGTGTSAAGTYQMTGQAINAPSTTITHGRGVEPKKITVWALDAGEWTDMGVTVVKDPANPTTKVIFYPAVNIANATIDFIF